MNVAAQINSSHCYYDPRTGRFLSLDTIGFAGNDFNLYGYVESNPMRYIDPNGLIKFEDVIEAAENAKDAIVDSLKDTKDKVKKNIDKIKNFADDAIEDVKKQFEKFNSDNEPDSEPEGNSC